MLATMLNQFLNFSDIGNYVKSTLDLLVIRTRLKAD